MQLFSGLLVAVGYAVASVCILSISTPLLAGVKVLRCFHGSVVSGEVFTPNDYPMIDISMVGDID